MGTIACIATLCIVFKALGKAISFAAKGALGIFGVGFIMMLMAIM